MKENLKLKRQLIVQSFLPLYVILLIKYFDKDALILVVRLFSAIKSIGLPATIWKALWHQCFLTYFVEMICIYLIIYSLMGLLHFSDVQISKYRSQADSVKDCADISDSGLTFFMSFVLPMILDDINELRGFIIFFIVMALLFILMWKTNLYYQNPILTILGYKVYSFKFENTQLIEFSDKDCIGITKNLKLKNGMTIKEVYITDIVFLIGENKKSRNSTAINAG